MLVPLYVFKILMKVNNLRGSFKKREEKTCKEANVTSVRICSSREDGTGVEKDKVLGRRSRESTYS